MPDPLPPLPSAAAWRERLAVAAERIGVPPGRLLAGAALAAAGGLLAIGVLALRAGGSGAPPPPLDLPRAAPDAAAVPAASGQGPASARPSTDVPAELVVHVTGAVADPGVYRLPGGSRASDAVAAAGGLTGDADGAGINLARPLADGDQVRVPRQGEPPEPAAAAVGAPGRSSSGPLDLNVATAADLESLPGIGPATARAILEHRSRNGPFRAVDDLLDVPGIGPARLERIRPHVRV